jgi:YihY family inner membrane protein
MASATSNAPDYTREPSSRRTNGSGQTVKRGEQAAKKEARTLGRFWTKLNNDWVFNFSGTLAYGFLTSIFPILLVIIAIGGILLGTISPGSRTQLENGIGNALPGGASGYGGQIVRAATHSLNSSAGLLLIVGIVTALIGGSGLFVTIENAFGVVFRLRGRNPIRQRIMAIGMLLIFVVLVPIILLASAVPPIVLRALAIGSSNPVAAFFIQVLGLAVAFVAAAILFAAIYIVVPNKPVKLKEVLKGTLAAAALLVLYEILFPFYESFFLKPGNYGSIVGFAVVIIIFFYYLAFILLAGAEVNSWALGQRETAGPIDAILHELQAHDTTRGAAGPTAGQPQEDLQDGKGARAMDDTHDAIEHERKDHHDDAQPPKYAESGVTGSGYRLTDTGKKGKKDKDKDHMAQPDELAGVPLGDLPGEHLDATDPQPPTYSETLRKRRERITTPLTARQKTAVAALAASAAVALAGVASVTAALLKGDDRTRATD